MPVHKYSLTTNIGNECVKRCAFQALVKRCDLKKSVKPGDLNKLWKLSDFKRLLKPSAFKRLVKRCAFKRLVKRCDFKRLVEYLTKKSESFEGLNDSDEYTIKNSDGNPDNRFYHILCSAIETLNFLVIQFFSDKINLNMSPPDGNCYDLLHYAIVTYMESYIDKKPDVQYRYYIIICLMKSHITNHPYNPPDCMPRNLVEFANYNNEYKLLTALVKNFGMSLDRFFHYSIVDDNKKVFNYIVTTLYNYIDFSCLKYTFDIAYKWKQFKMIIHVVSFLRSINKEEHIPKKYQFYIGEIHFYEHQLFGDDTDL